MSDPVKAPAHYEGDGKITCKDAMRSMMYDASTAPIQSYWWACAFKYLWRWPHKGNRLQDLEKCVQCIQEIIKEERRGPNE